jgi:serine/threonine-protein kinase
MKPTAVNAAGCPDENDLAEFTAGLLPPDVGRGVEEHLDRCRDCRRLVALLVRSTAPEPTASASPAVAGLPPAGLVLAGRFRLGPLVGRGAMGRVHEARDELLGARVAIKLLLPEIAAQPKLIEHLYREVLVGRRVSHPNVCRLYDLWTDGELHFITMEFVAGETLESRLKRGAMRPAEAGQILDQILGALEAAHREGVVHRDLKPGNIMLAEDGRVKVMDFGLARDLLAESTMHGHPVGTPAYWAPEQARGEAVTTTADLYALGLCAHEMLAGRKLRRGAPDAFAGVPIAYRGFVGRCVKERPAERFLTAQVARLALDRARRASPLRRGRLVLAALAAVLALAALGATGLRRWPRARPAAPVATASGPAPRADRPKATMTPLDRASVLQRREHVGRAARTRFIEVDVIPRVRDLLGRADDALRRGALSGASEHLGQAERLLAGGEPEASLVVH